MEDTAAKILERKLNESRAAGYEKFEVINAGVGNYDTVQEVTYYELGAELSIRTWSSWFSSSTTRSRYP